MGSKSLVAVPLWAERYLMGMNIIEIQRYNGKNHNPASAGF
jgi:hypothetical protein